MRKIVTFVFALSLIFLAMGCASAANAKASIKVIDLLGKGIAVSPTDPMVFMIAKVGIGTVEVSLAGEVTEMDVGVLKLDNDTYKLKAITHGEGSIEADVYLGDDEKGSMEIASVEKEDVVIWAGTLELDGTDYYLYILEASRPVKGSEIVDKVSDYCKDREDEPNCRDKVLNYCKNNPTDSRCVALFKKYCETHLDDARCREAIKEACEEDPTLAICDRLETRLSKFCEKHQRSAGCMEYCQNHPGECEVTTTVRKTTSSSTSTTAPATTTTTTTTTVSTTTTAPATTTTTPATTTTTVPATTDSTTTTTTTSTTTDSTTTTGGG
ncbi:hypothetical protein A3K63_04910 [Candidatus Micrarchaeota archaeon RBG_16_49_10]|nr:MAG: hypothetical protein A3K63_04910 [Candidatus Micrarchaeota archaeon RBG_16_49_10]